MSDPLDRARSISSAEEAAQLYAEWASTYDEDVFGVLGVTGSARIAELLVSVLADPAQPVVDLGCGTGAVGQRLAQLGVTTIDGIDLSPEMLTVAARTGAYRNLTVGDLNDLPDHFERDVCGVGERRHLHHGTRGAGRRPEIDGAAPTRGRRRVGDRRRALASVRTRARNDRTGRAASVDRVDPTRRSARGRDVRRSFALTDGARLSNHVCTFRPCPARSCFVP